MPWFVLTIGSIFLNAICDTIRRAVLSGKNKIDYYTVAFLLSLVVTVVLIIYTSLTKFIMPPIQTFKVIFIINIAMGVIGQLTSQIGLSLIGIGEFTVLMTTRQIFTWIGSILWLGVGLTFFQGIGSILIIAGLILVFATKKLFGNYPIKGLSFTAITAIMYGVAFIIDLLIYRKSDPASYLIFAYGSVVLFLPIFKPRVIKSTKLIFSKSGLPIIVMGVFAAFSSLLLFTALKRANNAPLVSGLFQLQIIVNVLFGIVFLKERKRLRKKIIGSVLATIGAILMVG